MLTPVLPLHVVVPLRFSARPDRSCVFDPLIASPPSVLVTPAPVIVPPVHVVDPVTFTVPTPPSTPLESANTPAMVVAPLSVSVPPDTVTAPLSVDAPETARAPLDTTRLSFESTCAASSPAAFTVTIGLVVGRSINTMSVAPGSVPPLQLAGTFQDSATFESLTQTLTPWKVLPRCRNTLLATTPVTYGSAPVGGSTVVKLPVVVPPTLMMWKASPTLAVKPDRWITFATAPALNTTLPVTLMAS